MLNIAVKDLADAGVHFGHQTGRWNPKMRKFIFGPHNGIHIIDLDKTLARLESACQFLYEAAIHQKPVLFICTKKQGQEIIRESAQRCNMPYVVERWVGGTLTNLSTIRRSVARYHEIEAMEKDGRMAALPKKEITSLRRELGHLNRNLHGILKMEKLPAALFVVDINREAIAVAEARRLNIPIVGIVDTNTDPDRVDYPIPSNDDAIRAIKLITEIVSSAILQAQNELAQRAPVPAPAAEVATPLEPVAVAAMA